MACSNNGCSGCNHFGVLGAVSGPLAHCGCGCGCGHHHSCNSCYQDFPYYTGPCGPCLYRDTCEGRKCINPYNNYGNYGFWGNGCARVSECASNLCSTSAHFHAAAPLMVAAGCAIPLQTNCSRQDCFLCSENGVLIRRPGSYMAIFTAHIPEMQRISTQLSLRLNGETLQDSIQNVSAIADGSCSASSSHLIFNALPNSMLQLFTSADISMACGTEDADIFRLTLVKL